MFLKGKTYDILRWVVQIVLPAIAALYFGLSGVWDLPFTKEIVGTVVAVNVYLGVLIGISNIQYQTAKVRELNILATNDVTTSFPFSMSTELYTLLKWIVLIFMPGTGALYLTISQLWGFPFGQEVVGTIAVMTAFFGVILGVSSIKRPK